MENLKQQLQKMGLKNTDTILIHSSLRHINRDPQLIVNTLIEYFDEGLVLLPTHTWAQMRNDNNYFDYKVEPSCVGLLTETFRKHPGVIRSIQPTHSMAGYGKKAKEYLDNDFKYSKSPCDPKGTWGQLGEVGAKILLIGCDMTRNTYVHAVEEIVDIPDRLTKEMINFEIVTEDGSVISRDYYKHDHSNYDNLSMNYKIAEQPLTNLGIIKKHKFGDADVLLMDAAELRDQIIFWLAHNKMLFDTDLPMNPKLAKMKYNK